MDKKIPNKKPKSTNPSLQHSEATQTDPSFNSMKLLLVQQEITDSLQEILNEFLNDFLARKKKRLDSKNPNTQMHIYNLVVNKSFKRKIRKQVNILISNSLSPKLHSILSEKISTFTQSLSKFLRDLESISKLLQLIFLYEAYRTVHNVSVEVGKIIGHIYANRTQSVDYMFNKEFHCLIIENSQELIKQISEYDESHFAIQEIMRMQGLIQSCISFPVTLTTNSSPLAEASQSSSEESAEEPLYNLPLEELVMYIEGDKKKKNKRTAPTSLSPGNEDFPELDQEINEFRQRIDLPISPERRRVNLSQDFLTQLRSELQRNK